MKRAMREQTTFHNLCLDDFEGLKNACFFLCDEEEDEDTVYKEVVKFINQNLTPETIYSPSPDIAPTHFLSLVQG